MAQSGNDTTLSTWCENNNFNFFHTLKYDAEIQTLEDLKKFSNEKLEVVCVALELSDVMKTKFMDAVWLLSNSNFINWCADNGLCNFTDSFKTQSFNDPWQFMNLTESELDNVIIAAGIKFGFKKKFLEAVKALRNIKNWCDSNELSKCMNILIEYGFNDPMDLAEINDDELREIVAIIDSKFRVGEIFSVAVESMKKSKSDRLDNALASDEKEEKEQSSEVVINEIKEEKKKGVYRKPDQTLDDR